jgi:hypothetical protein
MGYEDSEDSEDWEDSEEPLNDEEYSNLEERIAILEQLETLTDDYIKTTSLFLMKCIETREEIWITKGDELAKIYRKEEKVLTDAYIALGGPDLSKGSDENKT